MRSIAILIALVYLGTAVQAATVFLRDGGRLQGTIVSSSGQDIQLKTGEMTVRIASDRIDHIDYSDGTPARSVPAPTPAPAYPPDRSIRRGRIWNLREPNFNEAPNELSLDLGLSAPISNVDFSAAGGGTDRNGGGGILAGIQYIHFLDQQLGLGFDFHYLGRSWTATQSLVPNAETNVSGGSEVFLGVLKFRFVPDGPVRPYLLGGLGVHHTSLTIDSSPNFFSNGWPDTNTFETRRLYDASSSGLATSVRFGVDFPSFPPAFVGFELGWTGLFNGKYNPTAAGSALGLGAQSGPLNVFTIGGHLGWRF